VKPVLSPPGNSPVFTLFDSWANLPNNPANAGRLSVARGQAVFNSAHTPGTGFGCISCHNVPNLGNNASASAAGFRRIGTDSVDILMQTKAKAPMDSLEAQRVQDMIDRVKTLPLYCLRPKSDTSSDTCGTHTTDVLTTDPGRALVTGRIADVGMFKPPILRNLAVRSPYFHAGAAPSIEHLINFYNLRFGFGLTAAQQADLANFIDEAL
jgi:cytochrome c peroxidase